MKHPTASSGPSSIDLMGLFSDGPVVLIAWKPEPGWPVHSISENVTALLDYSASEILSGEFHYINLIHPDDAARVMNHAEARLASGARQFEHAYRAIGKNGASRWIHGFIKPKYDASGQVLLIQGYLLDQTKQKRMEQMKDEFVSVVSHELRTPLTAINGAIGLLAGGAAGRLPEEAVRMLGVAQKNTQRLTDLINDLLDMEHIATGKMRFDMRVQELMPLVEKALAANATHASRHQVSFAITLRADKALVRVDDQRLMQILATFLSNAAKFSPPDGEVRVAVREHGGLMRVEVQDDGPGIPRDFQDRLFQKFTQADSSATRQKGGTGLGLAIAMELTKRMDGRVGFFSEQDSGATFYLDLPCVAQ